MSDKLEKVLLGFASGVMVAASVWSLIIPSLEMSASRWELSWFPASAGIMGGILFLPLLDSVIPHLHVSSGEPEGIRSTKIKKTMMMVLAVTLHNIPEGMAVGVVLAGALSSGTNISMASAFALSVGIAIQNIPEGAIISMPLKSESLSKGRSFLYGVLSGIVEPIGALFTLLLSNIIESILPFLLPFAAGAMLYVVVEELIPESQNGRHSNIGTIGFSIGFVLMMILDVALG